MRRLSPLVLLLFGVSLLTACDNMAKQPHDKTWTPANGNSANAGPDRKVWPPQPAPNAIAREDRPQPPPALTAALLARGKERYGSIARPAMAISATATA